jgi:prepilin-type N-terminal cleavage/methylation domain-containing protein
MMITFRRLFSGNNYLKVCRGQNGFTLVEVLLGILIFSMITLSLYSVFAAGVNLNKRTERSLKISREASKIMDRMAGDFGNMAFYDFSGSYPDKKCYLVEQNSFGFLIRTDRGLQAIRYILQPVDLGKVHETLLGRTTKRNVAVTMKYSEPINLMALVREEQELREFLKVGFTGAIPEVLSRSVLREEMKIYNAAAVKVGERKIPWVGGWTKKSLPRGVRVELTLIAGDPLGKTTFVRDFFIPTGEWHE